MVAWFMDLAHREWQKIDIFYLNIGLGLTFFIDFGHIDVPNGRFWGFSNGPHKGDLVMNLFSVRGPLFMAW